MILHCKSVGLVADTESLGVPDCVNRQRNLSSLFKMHTRFHNWFSRKN
jgi:hypothetical protein